MDISVSKHYSKSYKVLSTETMTELAGSITKQDNWTPGVFLQNTRNLKHFKYADVIALDIDGGLTLKDALELFKGYRHIIATTRSHNKNKNGVTCDRFRVVLQLNRRIFNKAEYTSTYKSLEKMFPQTDPVCSDASRMFYASSTVVSCSNIGMVVNVVKEKTVQTKVKTNHMQRGLVSRETLRFLMQGAKPGQWNEKLNKAAFDLKSQGYTKEECLEELRYATRAYQGDLDAQDERCVNSVYASDAVYEPRTCGIEFVHVGEMIKKPKAFSWVVEDLLLEAGLSILSGAPKIGKSTIVRQLIKAVSRGESFFGRQCDKGKVLYMALEDHAGWIVNDLKKVGVTKDDDIFIHTGSINGDNRVEVLSNILELEKPSLVVLDTMALFLNISDLNNYAEVNKAMQSLRDAARNSQSHIMVIHHTNKSKFHDGSSIMGSQAFFGAVDNSMIMYTQGNTRYIKSDQSGGVPFNSEQLVFDQATLTYRLKRLLDGF